jgi:integrase
VVTHLIWWKESQYGQLGLDEIQGCLRQASQEIADGDRSDATVNRYLASLSGVMKAAHEDNPLVVDLVSVGSAKRQEPKGRERFLEKHEIVTLLDTCREIDHTLFAFVLLALSSGARAGELRKLRWNDTDLRKGSAAIYDTKNGENRRIYFKNPEAIAALRELKKVQRVDGLVFGEYEYRWPYDKALKAAEIEDFKFHDLRHTAASHMAMNGATTADIAAFLGHKTLMMVQRYAHLSETHIGDKAASMNAAMFGGANE